MKTVFLSYLIFSCALVGLIRCSEDNGCGNEPMELLDFEDFGCPNSAANVNVVSLNEFELIRDQEDYDFHIEAKCDPAIDWIQNDLIAGTVFLTRGFSSIDKKLRMNCNRNRLELTFDINLNLTQVAPQVTFEAIIPKLKDAQGFFVKVNINE